jgi:hypothetical protein
MPRVNTHWHSKTNVLTESTSFEDDVRRIVKETGGHVTFYDR